MADAGVGDVVAASGALVFSFLKEEMPVIETLADAYAVPLPKSNDYRLAQYLRATCAAAERAAPGSDAAGQLVTRLGDYRARNRERLAGVRTADGYTLDMLVWIAYAKLSVVAHSSHWDRRWYVIDRLSHPLRFASWVRNAVSRTRK